MPNGQINTKKNLIFRVCVISTAILLSVMIAIPQQSQAQGGVCQTFGVTTPRTIPLQGVHAGDTVTVDATLFSDDLTESIEGEPLILNSPGLGTKTLSLPLGAFQVSAHYSFQAAQDNEVINAQIEDFDSDESASVTVCVNTIAITIADIRTDRIEVVLPASGSGELVLTLMGDMNVPLFDGIKSDGMYTFSFMPRTLPEGQFTKVQAAWTVNGSTRTASRDVHFRVLGSYRHSQYNVPDESTCDALTSLGYITTSSCVFKSAQLRSMFISQANLNGSGHSINFGDIKREAFCIAPSHHPPPGAANRSFRPGAVTPTCSGQSLNDSTVARRPGHPLLDCGDQILIVGLGTGVGKIKTVTDLCPACPENQLDNFTTKKACSKIGDLGHYNTIRLR
jgi:hypothetical protein